jgi:hypothetical protein
MCMYVYSYVCVYLRLFTDMFVCRLMCMCVCICVYVFQRMCMHCNTYLYIHISTCMCACICLSMFSTSVYHTRTATWNAYTEHLVKISHIFWHANVPNHVNVRTGPKIQRPNFWNHRTGWHNVEACILKKARAIILQNYARFKAKPVFWALTQLLHNTSTYIYTSQNIYITTIASW